MRTFAIVQARHGHVSMIERRMENILTKPWSWLYATCFLDLLSASLLMPVFNSHLRVIGLSHTTIGLLSSIYGIAQLLSSPIIGSWSDINGRNSILILSLLLCSLGYGVMGIVSSFYLFVIVRCIIGTFKHTQTLCRAFVADIVPLLEQTSVYGVMNAVTSLAFMIGPLISGHIMEFDDGFQYLTMIVFMIFIINASIVYTFAPNSSGTKLNNADATSNNNPNYAKITLVFRELYSIEWNQFWMYYIIKFLFTLGSLIYFQNLGVMLTENFDVSPRYIGYTISFYGFVSVVCNLGVGKIERLAILPKTHSRSVIFSLSLMSMSFFVLSFVNNYKLFMLGLVPLAAGHAITRILLTEVLLERSKANCRGSLVGASSSIASIARTLTPFTSGLVFAWGGTSMALVTSSAITAVACFLAAIYYRQPHCKYN